MIFRQIKKNFQKSELDKYLKGQALLGTLLGDVTRVE